MSFTVKNDILQDHDVAVAYRQTPNLSARKIAPRFITLHYTVSLSLDSTADYIVNPKSRVSYHLIVGRDGDVMQFAPLTARTWHAGPSTWKGWNDLNSHSIGLAFVNMGHLRKRGSLFIGDKESQFSQAQIGDTVEAPHARVGSATRHWQTYTKAQIETGLEIVEALVAAYDIRDIVSHEEIDTRGWKTDPGPAFPMQMFRAALDESDGDRLEIVEVRADRLNVRTGPGVTFPVFDVLSIGSIVPVVRRHGDWVMIDEQKGHWVHSAFLRFP